MNQALFLTISATCCGTEATETLRAVAHPHRLLIVEMLYRQKSMNVTEMYERLGIEQAVASHHLRILKDRGLIDPKSKLYDSFIYNRRGYGAEGVDEGDHRFVGRYPY